MFRTIRMINSKEIWFVVCIGEVKVTQTLSLNTTPGIVLIIETKGGIGVVKVCQRSCKRGEVSSCLYNFNVTLVLSKSFIWKSLVLMQLLVGLQDGKAYLLIISLDVNFDLIFFILGFLALVNWHWSVIRFKLPVDKSD